MTDLIEQLRKKLDGQGIHTLRQIGRAVGVYSPTNKKKEELVDDIIAIAKCESDPVVSSGRGAPPKSGEYDQAIVEHINKCRKYFEGAKKEEEENNRYFSVESGEKELDETYTGVLEMSDKFWFVRTNNLQISSTNDVFIPAPFVSRFHLKQGDFIVCRAHRRKENECPGASFIVSVNGELPTVEKRNNFDMLTACYPERRLTLEKENGTLTERVIDLFSPIGAGQRALVVSPPKAGKTTLIKHIAKSLTANYPTLKTMILLIDERPEEVTDLKKSVGMAEVFYSTFDKGDNHHIHTAQLALDYAKRQVESGKDVVILMDSLTRLTRAFNAVCNSGRTLSGGLDPQAIVEPKKFFGAARNTEESGSLTIIATALVDTGSKLDDIIYEEFKSTGNMEIVLSRDLAESRIFPAIDIRSSGARKEELLLSEDELTASALVRSHLGKKITQEKLYEAIKQTSSNSEFCAKAKTFLDLTK